MSKFNYRLIKFINFINVNINKRKLKVEYNYHPHYINILEKLLNFNLIEGFFVKKESKKIIIFFKFNNLGENLLENIENKYKRPFLKTWRYSYLKNLNIKKKLRLSNYKIKKNYVILTTTKGLLTPEEAVNNKLGGILYMVINCN